MPRRVGQFAHFLLASVLSGCATIPASPDVGIPAGQYAAAFQAAKDAVRDYQFELDRVDAEGGVITTHTRGSSGLATPWLPHTDSGGGAWRGLVQRERRRVEVVFWPAGAEPACDGTSGAHSSAVALRPPLDQGAAMTARVSVFVERVYRPGRRVDATSVRLSSFASDPELKELGLEPAFAVVDRPDPSLQSRIAGDIARRISGGVRGGGQRVHPEHVVGAGHADLHPSRDSID